MKIKKFRAKTFREALCLVKKEMGDDAVILGTNERRGITPSVEVTAAVDYDIGGRPEECAAGALRPGGAAEWQCKGPATAAQTTVSPEAPDMKGLREEIEGIRNMMNDMRLSSMRRSLPDEKKKVYQYLRKCAVRPDLAIGLSAAAPGPGDITGALARNIRTRSESEMQKAVAVVGPTGVGKTTTIAKLAARSVKKGKKAALINLDTYRVGASEQLRIYSRIIGIPLDTVSSRDELRRSLSKYASRDAIFIDTPGRNPKDKGSLEELRSLADLGFPLETHLLLSANCDDEFLWMAYRHYDACRIDCLGFTKVDEAVRFGSIYNLATKYKKPVAYITTGQKVPQDIRFSTSSGLAAMILGEGLQS
ncbi:MAG: flagellar biosynthesis protein FlhF [Nitrospiraceae bacterium]|nr:flagellar biosynthesis protein FlhF [Nitrospiraceae bacterium]